MTPTRRRWVLATLSAAGVIIANSAGIAVGDDGVGYIAIADSLSSGRGLGYFLERPVTIWPPTWPTLMSIVDRISPLGAEGAAIALNAFTAVVVVVLADLLLSRHIRSERVVWLGSSVVALGASSMLFGHLLMTDFAFSAVVLALLLVLPGVRGDHPLRALLGSAGLVWVGFSIRYAGIALVASGALWLLAERGRPFTRRLANAAVFSGTSVIVPVLWALRNRSVDGTALGVRYSSSRGLLPNVADTLATVGNFLIPGVAIETRSLWALIGLAGTAAVAVAALAVAGGRPGTLAGPDGQIASFIGSPIGLIAVHATTYLAYMVYARTTTGLNRLDFRLLNPAYLPLVALGLVVADRASALRVDPRAGRSLIGRAAPVAVVSWAVLNVAVGVGMVGWFTTDPDVFEGNYNGRSFDEARTSDALDVIPPDCQVVSNLPNALYEAGIEATWSPRLTGLESDDTVDDLRQLERRLRAPHHRDVCLVWFDMQPRYGHLAPLATLQKTFRLVEIRDDAPVRLYRVESRRAAA